MSWLTKNLPSLFVCAPDGTSHFRFKRYYIYECEDKEINKVTKVYIFKNNLSFTLDSDSFNYIKFERSKSFLKTKESFNEYKILESINNEKDKMISKLQEDINKIEIQKSLLEDAYGGSLGENIELKEKNSMLKGKIESKIEEKKEMREWFDNEINRREELIKSLRDVINKFREELNNVVTDLNNKNSDNIEKLRKEFEMLDRDFVDVAKSMGLFNSENSRPKTGFRIKI
jgi:predicted nuclease with TOPRIM domain